MRVRNRRKKQNQLGLILLVLGAGIGVLFSLLISLPLLLSTTTYKTRAAYPKCQDRIVAAGTGWYWKADCARVCTDPQNHSDCPENPEDPNPKTSNWCYLFEEGLRCMKRVKEDAAPPPGNSSSSSSMSQNQNTGGACFSLSTHVYADKDGDGWKFNTHVRVFSPEGGKDGHIQLFVNGNSKGWNQPWNKNVSNPFDIEPQYTDTRRLTSGSVSMNYKIKVDECGDMGNTHDITCTYGVSNGAPYIVGDGCECKTGNCVAPPSNSGNPPTQSSSSIKSGGSPAGSSSSKKTSSSSSKPKSSSSSKPRSSSSSSYTGYCRFVNGKCQGTCSSGTCIQDFSETDYCKCAKAQSSSSSYTGYCSFVNGKCQGTCSSGTCTQDDSETDYCKCTASSSSSNNIYLPIVVNQSTSSSTPVLSCQQSSCNPPSEQVSYWKKAEWFYPNESSCNTGTNKIAPYGIDSYCSGQPRNVGVSVYLWMDGKVKSDSPAYVAFGWSNGAGWIREKLWTVPPSAFDSAQYTVADNAAITLPVYCPTCAYSVLMCYVEKATDELTCISSGSVKYANSMLFGLNVKK